MDHEEALQVVRAVLFAEVGVAFDAVTVNTNVYHDLGVSWPNDQDFYVVLLEVLTKLECALERRHHGCDVMVEDEVIEVLARDFYRGMTVGNLIRAALGQPVELEEISFLGGELVVFESAF